MNIDNAKADFKQALIISLSQFVEDQYARIVRERAENRGELRIMWKSHDGNMQQMCCMSIIPQDSGGGYNGVPLPWRA